MLHPVPAIDNFLEVSAVQFCARARLCGVALILCLLSDRVRPSRLARDTGHHHRGQRGRLFPAGGRTSSHPLQHAPHRFIRNL